MCSLICILAVLICRYHNPTLSSFMTYHRARNKSNTTGATYGDGTIYPFDAHEFTPLLPLNSVLTLYTVVFTMRPLVCILAFFYDICLALLPFTFI